MQSRLTLPISILVAGLFIAGGMAISKLIKGGETNTAEQNLSIVRTLSAEDHYFGNPKASVLVIEYSDYDCPFCAGYFKNIKKIIEELGKSGKVVWVHRHMPLYQIHETARDKAELAECVAYVGGEEKFWQLSESLYANRESDKDALLTTLGIDIGKINECLSSDRFLPVIDAEYNEAYAAGGRGTPFTVLITPKKRYAVSESLPYFELRSLVESLISEAE
jgi:protein-disulfide isomerase